MLYRRLPGKSANGVKHNPKSVHGGLTFIVEAVYPVNGCALVVATQKEEIFGVFDLVGQQQADCLEALQSINAVT